MGCTLYMYLSRTQNHTVWYPSDAQSTKQIDHSVLPPKINVFHKPDSAQLNDYYYNLHMFIVHTSHLGCVFKEQAGVN